MRTDTLYIDIRNIPVFYINLEEHTQNKIEIEEKLRSKGFTNINRVPGIRVSGYNSKAYLQQIDHFMGVGLAQINAMRCANQKLPALVLEDDVDFSEDFNPFIQVPKNADAVYLGVSCVGNAYGYKLKPPFENTIKIFNVLAAHAILYVNTDFVNQVIELSKNSLIKDQCPFDLPLSTFINTKNVYSPLKPYFYQSNKKQSANKWEELTNKPLKIYGN